MTYSVNAGKPIYGLGGGIGYLKDRLLRKEFAPDSLLPDELRQESKDETNKQDYYEVVKKPIDLAMIKEKLGERKYRTMPMLEDDMELMFANARLFHRVNKPPHGSSEVLQEIEGYGVGDVGAGFGG
eukprot:COSAG05_NODE_8724_length_677_cov_0.858131_2_plen_127_part_00